MLYDGDGGIPDNLLSQMDFKLVDQEAEGKRVEICKVIPDFFYGLQNVKLCFLRKSLSLLLFNIFHIINPTPAVRLPMKNIKCSQICFLHCNQQI